MKEREASPLVKKVIDKVNNELVHLGGLTDQHTKFITYFVNQVLKFENFRFELRYLESPKRFIIHVYTVDGQEVWCKPKPADILDKMEKHLKMEGWRIEFAKRV